MSYPAKTVANSLLKKYFEAGEPITNLKLQKSLYFLASEYEKDTGRPLLYEPFQSWTYGPVLISVHDKFKAYKGSPITQYIVDPLTGSEIVDESREPFFAGALARVWEATRHRAVAELVNISQAEGSPWHKAWMNDKPVIDPVAVKDDKTYQKALGLTRD